MTVNVTVGGILDGISLLTVAFLMVLFALGMLAGGVFTVASAVVYAMLAYTVYIYFGGEEVV